MSDPSAQISQPVLFRLSLACEVGEVRPATKAVRVFLVAQGLAEDEARACELALVEACNNAIHYVGEPSQRQPFQIDVLCDPTQVELRVSDHTAGFDWPARVGLPAKGSERGRGLYLIQKLMDGAHYLRGREENCLVMRKRRGLPPPRVRPSADPQADQLKSRLAESEEVLAQMAEELSSCYESLAAIFRYNAELGKTPDLEDFARRLLNDLLQITGADWFVLRLVAKEGARLAVFCASEPFQTSPPVNAAPGSGASDSVEAEAAVTRQDVWFDVQRPLAAGDPLGQVRPGAMGLVHPFFFGETFFGTLTLGKSGSPQPFTAAQTNVIHTFADFLAIQIVNARFREEQVNSRLVSHELDIAQNIQRSLLPKSLPQLPGIGLAGFCESARQVGGDFYDVLQLGQHSLLLVIADVMGKGIPAAMFAAILRSLVRAAPELSSQPAALLARVNRLLYDDLSGVEMFITAQLVFVDAKHRWLVTASAGHCPALLAVAADGPVRALSPEGMPLGILPDTAFSDETAELAAHSRLLLYTDGLTEARNAKGELFGQHRLSDWLKQTAARPLTAEQLKIELAAELARFNANRAFTDDQTFLILADERPASA